MFGKILIGVMILTVCVSFVRSETQTRNRSRKRQATYGSTSLAAGNPNRPTFELSPAQTADLPPIHPEIYQDTLLPTVITHSQHSSKRSSRRLYSIKSNPISNLSINSHFCHSNEAIQLRFIELLRPTAIF